MGSKARPSAPLASAATCAHVDVGAWPQGIAQAGEHEPTSNAQHSTDATMTERAGREVEAASSRRRESVKRRGPALHERSQAGGRSESERAAARQGAGVSGSGLHP